MDNQSIGKTSVPSSTQDVSIVVTASSHLDELKNKMVYFDVDTQGREGTETTSRAFAFINEIRTENGVPGTAPMLRLDTANTVSSFRSSEYRTISLKVASTFSKSGDSWGGGAPLPTSPSVGTKVFTVDQDLIGSLFDAKTLSQFAYLGTLRGGGGVNAPLTLPYFGGKRGASSSCVCGKTGSGKTSFTTSLIGSQMKHKDHAIIVVDPQGQWNNENGFVYSPQSIAKALGREVVNIRVGEDIRLDLTEENFTEMLSIIDAFAKVGRMAKENRDLLALEVAEIIVRRGYRFLDKDHKELLSEVFSTIMNSKATLRRIYASDDRQESLKDSLMELVANDEMRFNNYVKEIKNEDAENLDEEMLSQLREAFIDAGLQLTEEEEASIELRWEKILSKFSPLLNLFMTKNLSGGSRKPLGGAHGFLESILKVRDQNSSPAPYVILDMSPDVKNKVKSELMGSSASQEMNMRKLLDNDSIKASILKMIFSALKESSEEAFANGGGNLNTQIVFDEAWRYAPNYSDDEIIMDLSKRLEGFALDTRKFGIGWTYILQSPTDLRDGIWKQLKYVYAGYGLVGADLKKIADLTDDATTQLQTYKQFTPPDLTGEYPFMIIGSISPLITAQIPLFINAYTGVEDFFEANEHWMTSVSKSEGLPPLNPSVITPGTTNRHVSKGEKKYSVGNTSEKMKPRQVKSTYQDFTNPTDDDLLPPPF